MNPASKTPQYKIGDNVEIVPLERPGRVMSIWITKNGVSYEVRYFDNAKAEIVYFYGDELKAKQ